MLKSELDLVRKISMGVGRNSAPGPLAPEIGMNYTRKVGWRNNRMENLQVGDPKLVKRTLEYVEKTKIWFDLID
jgi:hypothetical protein